MHEYDTYMNTSHHSHVFTTHMNVLLLTCMTAYMYACVHFYEYTLLFSCDEMWHVSSFVSIMSPFNESCLLCLLSTSHVSYLWVLWWDVTYIIFCVKHVSCQWVMSPIPPVNQSCLLSMGVVMRCDIYHLLCQSDSYRWCAYLGVVMRCDIYHHACHQVGIEVGVVVVRRHIIYHI